MTHLRSHKTATTESDDRKSLTVGKRQGDDDGAALNLPQLKEEPQRGQALQQVSQIHTRVYKTSSCKVLEMLKFWFHHRSGSTHTILRCSSQMTVRRRVSREFWSHQESGSTLRYRQGSLSSSGSSFWEQVSSCSSDRAWRCSLDLRVDQEASASHRSAALERAHSWF